MENTEIIKDLNKLLANMAIMKQKAYNYHWNVKGDNFMVSHKMTEDLFEGLTELFDDIAEKIAMQGSRPYSTFGEYINNSIIKEIDDTSFTPEVVADSISKDLKTLKDIALKVKVNEFTQPLMDEVFMFLDKQEWFFRSSK